MTWQVSAIICHLGAGASMAAVQHGKCVDTTMGLTPLEGLVMATRAGDVDAGVLNFLSSQLQYSPEKIDALLNKQSGLQGMCGMGDWRAISAAAIEGNEQAQLARAVFVERIRKYLGAYLVKVRPSLLPTFSYCTLLMRLLLTVPLPRPCPPLALAAGRRG